MIKCVIFDFDGVIVESVNIKTEAFREIFRDYPQHLPAILNYHLENGGISRQEKIKYFYKKIIRKPLDQKTLERLCKQFEHLVMQKVIAAPFVKGAKELLDRCLGKYLMFVVSGTPQSEVREIVSQRKLEKYFKGVFGSPAKKEDLVKKILKDYKLSKKEVVFIGDAITDLNAAKKNNIYFIGRYETPNVSWKDNAYPTASFPNLTKVYNVIEKLNG